MPVVLAFRPPESKTMGWNLHLYAMTAIFAFDLFVNFRTTYFEAEDGEEIHDGKMMALNYLSNMQFIVDLISTIPWDIALQGVVSEDLNGGLACLRLLRIGRIGSISTLIANLKFDRGIKSFIRLLQLILMMYLFIHIQGCLFYLCVSLF
jgi:Ion transport protein